MVAAGGDHDVVDERHTHHLGGFGDRLGHRDVGRGGLGRAAGVIVDEQEPARRIGQGRGQYFAGGDDETVTTALSDAADAADATSPVERDHPHALVIQVDDPRQKPRRDALRGGEGLTIRHLSQQDAVAELDRSAEAKRLGGAEPRNVSEQGRPGPGETLEAPDPIEHRLGEGEDRLAAYAVAEDEREEVSIVEAREAFAVGSVARTDACRGDELLGHAQAPSKGRARRKGPKWPNIAARRGGGRRHPPPIRHSFAELIR